VPKPAYKSFPSHYSFLHITALIESSRLAQETAQGNNLGVLYRCSRRLIGLTGTLMGGYADDRAPRRREGGFMN
jgi:hypothetical protein